MQSTVNHHPENAGTKYHHHINQEGVDALLNYKPTKNAKPAHSSMATSRLQDAQDQQQVSKVRNNSAPSHV